MGGSNTVAGVIVQGDLGWMKLEERLEEMKGVKRKIRKEKKELRKRTMGKIREQGGTSYKLFWTSLRGKRRQRRLNRMKDEEGRIVEGEDEVLEVMARHWRNLGAVVRTVVRIM